MPITEAATNIAQRRIAPIPRRAPRLNYQVMPAEAVASHAARMIIEVAKQKRGTFLPPGCNTPSRMYQQLFVEGGALLSPLLQGKEGDVAMGMIDGVEWRIAHPYSFHYYLHQRFLGRFAFAPIRSIEDPVVRRAAIERVYAAFKNVYVPDIPIEATESEKLGFVDKFNSGSVRACRST